MKIKSQIKNPNMNGKIFSLVKSNLVKSKLVLIILIHVLGLLTFYGQRVSLERFQNQGGLDTYAADSLHKKKLKAAQSQPPGKTRYDSLGEVGYVYTKPTAGTVQLYTIMRPSQFGNVFFYSIDFDEILNVQNTTNDWYVGDFKNGITCYVSKIAKPGTIPVYRFKRKNEKEWIYAFGEKEKKLWENKKSVISEGIIFHIWKTAEDEKVEFPTAEVKQDYFPRGMVYYLGNQPIKYGDKIDTKQKWGSENKPLILKKSEAVLCDSEYCTFNLGFLVSRTVKDSGKTYASIFVSGGISGNTVSFPADSTYTQMLLSVKIKIGINKAEIRVDPNNSKAETNEANNSFEITITVQE